MKLAFGCHFTHPALVFLVLLFHFLRGKKNLLFFFFLLAFFSVSSRSVGVHLVLKTFSTE